ncbi:MAG: hypothetical protein PF689_01450 [Deltaproteobacteria bacterium]|jgi:hypothetical protein|nr:hypothetical protein [Deltaproteobacteria bacterium]
MKTKDVISINKIKTWSIRLGISLSLALIVGGMPVYIHQELQEVENLKSELREIRKLNKRLYVDLENSVSKLRSLKEKEGMERVFRERGYSPPGSLVYQLKTTE